MALDNKNYLPSFQYGAKVTGVETSLLNYYAQIAVGSAGTTPVNVLGVATSPVAGTVTGFMVSAGATTTAGTAILVGTTAGTIAIIAFGTTVGTITGTNVLNSAIAAGDAFTVVSSNAGTFTAFITFQTAS